MLYKVIEISNVGCFSKYSAAGDVSFRKMNLIYAENGRGKTTLCAILRSLQCGLPELITERKTLSSIEPASVNLLLDDKNLCFKNGAWNYLYPDVVIFDSVFVNNNVYSGDYVEHEHKKNLYRVIVGKRGVELAKKIDSTDNKIREANNVLRVKKESLQKILPSGVKLEEYLKWEPVEDIHDKLHKTTSELSKRLQIVERSKEIRERDLLSEIELPRIPPDFIDLLNKEMTDIMDDAEIKVREQIVQHEMGSGGESWLSQGLGYIKNDRCPFCGNDILSNTLVSSYRSFFNEFYRHLKMEVSQLKQLVNSSLGESPLYLTQQLLSNNVALAEFWKQFLEIKVPDISFTDIKQKISALHNCCLGLANKKQDNPTKAVRPGPDFFKAKKDLEIMGKTLKEYNKVIHSLNEEIKEKKSATYKEEDIDILRNRVKELEDHKNRFGKETAIICDAYREAKKVKDQLEIEKQTAKKQLDQHCSDLISNYEKSINNYLDQFNAGFRIVNSRHQYRGGAPSSHYQIEINNTAVDLGDSRTQPGVPCFKTTLSSGDRSALALAFFLATLKQDSDHTNKIIVFDDPFTSLDRFRRTCTQQLIQKFAETAQQIVVLSHDPFFLKLIWDEYSITDIKTLQMAKKSNTTVIVEWDIEQEVQSTYLKDFSTLLNFYRDREGEPRLVAKTIRPFLEGMLRNHFPGHFLKNEWLGDFIGKIREAGPDSGLNHAKDDLGELTDINSYSKNFHHDQNVKADSEPINEDELHGFVKRTLNLVGGC